MDLLNQEAQISTRGGILDQAAKIVNTLPDSHFEDKKDDSGNFPEKFIKSFHLHFWRIWEELNKISKSDYQSREPFLQQRALMMSLAAGNPELEKVINDNLEHERSASFKTSGA